MAQTGFQYHFLALFLHLAGRCWSGRRHCRAGGRRGRVDLLRWLGGRAGGHRAPRPRPAERPSGRGKHMQSTWPDLELNSDSHAHIFTPTHVCTHTARVALFGKDTQLLSSTQTHTHTCWKTGMCCRRTFAAVNQGCISVAAYMTHTMIFVQYIMNTSVDYIQPETPTQTHTCLPHSTRRSMVTLSPSESDCQWVFYIWLEQILPVLLWRVLHLVKSHYYGNVRVLEIMARWEPLDCFWHNNPTLSISSVSSLALALYYNSLYLAVSLPDLPLLLIGKLLFFLPTCSGAILSLKSNIIGRAFAQQR